MIRKFLLLTTAALAGCGEVSDTIALSASSVGELIRSGDPKACAHPDVEAKIREQIAQSSSGQSELFSAEEVSDAEVDTKTAFFSHQALEVDTSVGAITCSIRVAIGDSEFDQPFLLRQSLTNHDEFLLGGSFFETQILWRAKVFKTLGERFPGREQAAKSKREAEDHAKQEAWAAKDPARWSCWQRVKDSGDNGAKNACLTTTIYLASQEEQEAWAAKDPARWACWQSVAPSGDQTKIASCLDATGFSPEEYASDEVYPKRMSNSPVQTKTDFVAGVGSGS